MIQKDDLKWLRAWFVFHFVVDMVVGLPLMLMPEKVMSCLGVGGSVVLARVVAAAFLGIGAESFLGRKGEISSFLGMLRLKIIWSGMAILGLGLGIYSGELSFAIGSGLVGVFVAFNVLWSYWLVKIKAN